MVIAGLDLSINSSGVVKFYLDENLNVTKSDYLGFTADKKIKHSKIHFYDDKKMKGYEKYTFMENVILEFLNDVDIVAIEDYAYGMSNSSSIFQLAEFEGFIKQTIYRQQKSMRLYDIPSIKLFSTGFGQSDKISMFEAYVKISEKFCDFSELPITLEVKDPKGKKTLSDLIDAYHICNFLLTELKLKKGILELKNLEEHVIRVFNRVTKHQPENLLSTEFIRINTI